VSLSAVIFMVLILGSYWIGFAVLLTIALRRGAPPDDEAPAIEAPAIEAPAIEAPAIEAPAIEAPAIEAPAAQEHPQEPSQR
jgi:hypothetical protein